MATAGGGGGAGSGGAGSGIIFQWLERIGLGHVVPVFEERGIHNPQLLMKLEVDDYDAVGVTSGACVRAVARGRARGRARMPAVARGCLRTCAWSCAWSRGGLGRPRPDEALGGSTPAHSRHERAPARLRRPRRAADHEKKRLYELVQRVRQAAKGAKQKQSAAGGAGESPQKQPAAPPPPGVASPPQPPPPRHQRQLGEFYGGSNEAGGGGAPTAHAPSRKSLARGMGGAAAAAADYDDGDDDEDGADFMPSSSATSPPAPRGGAPADYTGGGLRRGGPQLPPWQAPPQQRSAGGERGPAAAGQVPSALPSSNGVGSGGTRAKTGVDRDGFELRRRPLPAQAASSKAAPPLEHAAHPRSVSPQQQQQQYDDAADAAVAATAGFSGAPPLVVRRPRPSAAGAAPGAATAAAPPPTTVQVMPSARARLERLERDRKSVGGVAAMQSAHLPRHAAAGDEEDDEGADAVDDEEAAAAAAYAPPSARPPPPSSSAAAGASRTSVMPSQRAALNRIAAAAAAAGPTTTAAAASAPPPPPPTSQAGSRKSMAPPPRAALAAARAAPEPWDEDAGVVVGAASSFGGRPGSAQPAPLPSSPSAARSPQHALPHPLSSSGLFDDSGPRIRVVVRKRPMSAREARQLRAGERDYFDCVQVPGRRSLALHENRVRVDNTPYIESHEFTFDEVFGEASPTEEVYRNTAQPLVGAVFRGINATCFAYGQTGRCAAVSVLRAR